MRFELGKKHLNGGCPYKVHVFYNNFQTKKDSMKHVLELIGMNSGSCGWIVLWYSKGNICNIFGWVRANYGNCAAY